MRTADDPPDAVGGLIDYHSTFDSGLLQHLAFEAAGRCEGRRFPLDALGAIVLSYSALEAFLNELAQLARTSVFNIGRRGDYADDAEHADLLRTLAIVLEIAINQRASLTYRFDIAWEVLSGIPPSKGVGARQDLTTLTGVRNSIVHLKAEQAQTYTRESEAAAAEFHAEFPGGTFLGVAVTRHTERPKWFAALAAKKLLAEGDKDERWVHLVCSAPLARWACAVVEDAAYGLVQRTPEGSEFRKELTQYSLAGRAARRSVGLDTSR